MRKTENFTHQLTKNNPIISISDYSTSLHSIIIRRVNFRRVFRLLISTSCIRRVVFDELSAYLKRMAKIWLKSLEKYFSTFLKLRNCANLINFCQNLKCLSFVFSVAELSNKYF